MAIRPGRKRPAQRIDELLEEFDRINIKRSLLGLPRVDPFDGLDLSAPALDDLDGASFGSLAPSPPVRAQNTSSGVGADTLSLLDSMVFDDVSVSFRPPQRRFRQPPRRVAPNDVTFANDQLDPNLLFGLQAPIPQEARSQAQNEGLAAAKRRADAMQAFLKQRNLQMREAVARKRAETEKREQERLAAREQQARELLARREQAAAKLRAQRKRFQQDVPERRRQALAETRVAPVQPELRQFNNLDARDLQEFASLFPERFRRDNSSKFGGSALRDRIGLALLPGSDAGKIDVIRKLFPDVEIGQDKFGRPVFVRNGRMAGINSKGLSGQDIREFINNVALGIPFGLAGAPAGAALGGFAAARLGVPLLRRAIAQGQPNLARLLGSRATIRSAGASTGGLASSFVGGFAGGGLLRDEITRQAGSQQGFESFTDPVAGLLDSGTFELLSAGARMVPGFLTQRLFRNRR